MLKRFQLIEHIGHFQAFTGNPTHDFSKLTLVYADNGRGKTTLSAILRSLAEQDPNAIIERKRLPVSGTPKVVLQLVQGSPCVFENAAWTATPPPIYVFDDHFVDTNVHSGLSVMAGHGQNLHEIVLGRTGVSLAIRMTALADEITQLTAEIRTAKASVDRHIGNATISADEYVALQVRPNIADLITEQDRQIAALASSAEVARTSAFDAITISDIDLAAFTALLATTLDTLNQAAMEVVQSHLTGLGPQSEEWVKSGVDRCPTEVPVAEQSCPFCAQPLSTSSVFAHYQSYFSEAYRNHLRLLRSGVSGLDRKLGTATVLALQTAAQEVNSRRAFWARYVACDVPDIDVTRLVSTTQTLHTEMKRLLDAKMSSPLDLVLPDDAMRAAHQAYVTQSAEAAATIKRLMASNTAITQLKQSTASTSSATLQAGLSRLKAEQARSTQEADAACAKYQQLQTDKISKETLKTKARNQLDMHRSTVFPKYAAATNAVLGAFHAGYSVELEPHNQSGRPSSRYGLKINNSSVPAVAPSGQQGVPCFKSALSAGDRTTLALAFFFAYVNAEHDKARAVVVLDDPVSSLDDFRAGTTIDQIKTLLDTTTQVIILSHSKPFLCEVWDRFVKRPAEAARVPSKPLQIPRFGAGSTITEWNILDLWLTDHDRRADLFETFLASATAIDAKDIAEKIRPHIESYCRSSFPEHFRPGELLGQGLESLRRRIGQPSQISQLVFDELKRLADYSNQFHHDGSPAWKCPMPKAQELEGNVKKLLELMRR